MESSGNGLSGERDLFISLPVKRPQTSAERSAHSSSGDDSNSTQTSRSAASTVATSGPVSPPPPKSATQGTHRYTITARTEGRDGKMHPGESRSELETHQSPVDMSTLPQETVTISRKSSKAAEPHFKPAAVLSQVSESTSALQPRTREEYGTATIFGSETLVPQDRTKSSARPNVISHRYPPTSYRGPVAASQEDIMPASLLKPSTSNSEKKGPPTELKFGKLTLEELSRAIDAPPSPHKPSGISRLVRRLSGRRRTEKATPPPSPRAAPKQLVAQVGRTESSSSIPSAPTPYTSPNASPSPSKLIKSRRRTLDASTALAFKTTESSSISHSHQATSTELSHTASTKSHSAHTTNTLPEPEIEYTKIHYFTHCPHSSPPSHRPINIQPTSTPFTATTLKHPPFHLRARLAASSTEHVEMPVISTIHGSCSDCDWKARRQQEGQVLASYADKRNILLGRIRSLRNHLSAADLNTTVKSNENNAENDSNDSANDSDDHGTRSHKTRKVGTETETDDLEAMDLELDMLTVESEIEELPEQQDKDVARVWTGWAQKWGVGTIGIHRSGPFDDTSTREERRDGTPTGTAIGTGTDASSACTEEDAEVEVEVVGEMSVPSSTILSSGIGSGPGSRTGTATGTGMETGTATATGTGTGTSKSKKSSQSVSSASQSREGKGLNKWGAGRFDDVVAEGRMRLDWIRPDIQREK